MNTLHQLQKEMVDLNDGLFPSGPIFVRLDPLDGERVYPFIGDIWLPTNSKREARNSSVASEVVGDQ